MSLATSQADAKALNEGGVYTLSFVPATSPQTAGTAATIPAQAVSEPVKEATAADPAKQEAAGQPASSGDATATN